MQQYLFPVIWNMQNKTCKLTDVYFHISQFQSYPISVCKIPAVLNGNQVLGLNLQGFWERQIQNNINLKWRHTSLRYLLQVNITFSRIARICLSAFWHEYPKYILNILGPYPTDYRKWRSSVVLCKSSPKVKRVRNNFENKGQKAQP